MLPVGWCGGLCLCPLEPALCLLMMLTHGPRPVSVRSSNALLSFKPCIAKQPH